LAGLACSSYTLAASAKVDLQVRNAYINKFTDGNSQYFVEFLYVVIQNNGPDDFNGTFSISASNGSRYGKEKFTGRINRGQSAVISVIGSPTSNPYSINVDSESEVVETKEGNNYFYFVRDEPQIIITPGWYGSNVNNSNDTLFVLPGEMIYSQFSLSEGNSKKDIVGIKYSMSSYNFSNDCQIYFGVQNRFGDNSDNATYSYEYENDQTTYPSSAKATFNWMANNSASAIDYFWLGDFSATNNKIVGEVKNIYLNVTVALTNLTNYYAGLMRSIKTIDRIRCDVNDDGVVDKADFDIMSEVVNEDIYNPCEPSKNLYKEKGLNYGAGIILFSRPDFASNCLLNIWLHDKNDPLVQGLGIGELMSNTQSRFAIEQTANSYSVVGNELVIDAPEADLYNVTAQKADGKLFQATGKMGESVQIPLNAKDIRVETVRLNNSETTTKLFAPKDQDKKLISVRSTYFSDQINISGTGKLTIVNLSGQTLFTGNLDGNELNIPTSNWSVGMYIAKAVSGGKIQTIKLVK